MTREVTKAEAIAHFKYGITHDIFSEPVLSYARLAIEALEKQIPQKPYMESDGDADGYPVWDSFCPVCMFDFDGYDPIHCPKCGQVIDWSEEQE